MVESLAVMRMDHDENMRYLQTRLSLDYVDSSLTHYSSDIDLSLYTIRETFKIHDRFHNTGCRMKIKTVLRVMHHLARVHYIASNISTFVKPL